MVTLFKPDTQSATTGKAWKYMNVNEKVLFASKVGIMVVSFGWIFGSAIAPAEVKPAKDQGIV